VPSPKLIILSAAFGSANLWVVDPGVPDRMRLQQFASIKKRSSKKSVDSYG
jgi:hypothetical protein